MKVFQFLVQASKGCNFESEVLKPVLACRSLLGWQNSKPKAGQLPAGWFRPVNCTFFLVGELFGFKKPLTVAITRGLEVDLTVYDSLIESAARHVFLLDCVVCNMGGRYLGSGEDRS